MDATEIAKLCAMFSTSNLDGPIRRVSGDLRSEGLQDVERCLVGKVLSGKRVNRDAFKRVIEQLCSPIGSVEIEAIGDNIFMFLFPSQEVRSLIWSRGPWHFDHNLIVLEKPSGPGAISKLSFRMVDFWVQIHNLPLMCMNRRMAKFLAEQIGTVIELPADSRECMGRFIRVKVRIDISKPLMRCVRLNVDDSGEVVTAILLYERLPEFCYACGIIGHGLRDCPDDAARTAALEGTSTQYGSWLRAASVEQSKGRASKKDVQGTDIAPSSSNHDTQSGKSSSTDKPSENNSNNRNGSPRSNYALLPKPLKETGNIRGEVVGFLVDSEAKLGSPAAGQSEGTKDQTVDQRLGTRPGGNFNQTEGGEMEMIESELVSCPVHGAQRQTPDNDGTSNKDSTRKWKRKARAKHVPPVPDPHVCQGSGSSGVLHIDENSGSGKRKDLY